MLVNILLLMLVILMLAVSEYFATVRPGFKIETSADADDRDFKE